MEKETSTSTNKIKLLLLRPLFLCEAVVKTGAVSIVKCSLISIFFLFFRGSGFFGTFKLFVFLCSNHRLCDPFVFRMIPFWLQKSIYYIKKRTKKDIILYEKKTTAYKTLTGWSEVYICVYKSSVCANPISTLPYLSYRTPSIVGSSVIFLPLVYLLA